MFRALALLTLAACATDGPSDEPDEPVEVDPGPAPTVQILAPADGEGSYGGGLSVSFEVSDFVLDPAGLGGANVAGHGHAHLYVDGVLEGEATEGVFTVEGVSAGTHTLEVRLAENDHTELGAGAERDFPALHPVLTVTSPADGALLTASNTPLAFGVTDFTVTAARGAPAVFGEGHVVVTADGSFRDWAVDPALPVNVTGLTPGAHTLAVELVDNGGLPLLPPVRAELSVTVPDLAPGVYFDRSVAEEPWDSAVLPIGITTANFLLAAPDGTGLPIAGTGYWHLYMDGVWVDGEAGTAHLMEGMAPGEHVFDLILAGNDLFELPIRDRMWVTIPADRPNVVVSYPGRDWVMGPAFGVAFSVENFTLDADAKGSPNSPHVGHAQISLDGVRLGETGSGTWRLSGLLSGAHTLRVELLANDGTPLDPPVYSEFPFTVS